MSATCVDNTGLGVGTSTCTFWTGPWSIAGGYTPPAGSHRASYNRWYRLHVPTSGSGPRPLVVVLHGGATLENNSENDMRTVVQMEAYGDTLNGGNGVLIAYPRSGQESSNNYQWNYGPEACAFQWLCEDDMGFVNAVIDDIKATHDVSPLHVALCGHSGGGMLILQMLCNDGRNPHATSAWAFGATLTDAAAALCTCPTRTPLYIGAGSQDGAIPYIGGTLGGAGGTPPIKSIENAAFNVIALGARQGSKDSFTSQKFGLDMDGECCVVTRHEEAHVSVFTMGSGVPATTADGCNCLNGMGHSWPGYWIDGHAGAYGGSPTAKVFDASQAILDRTVTPRDAIRPIAGFYHQATCSASPGFSWRRAAVDLNYIKQPGDRLEYDILFKGTDVTRTRGCFDLRTDDGVGGLHYLNVEGGPDQNGLSSVANTELGAQAWNQWYARIIPLPDSWNGLIITEGATAISVLFVGQSETMIIKNVRITDSSGVVALVINPGAASLVNRGVWYAFELNVTVIADIRVVAIDWTDKQAGA